MSSQQEYSLLIVESESIAAIIRQFDIPYLEVMATHGFCWKPKFNWRKNKLEMRAVHDKLSVRKLLKEKAPWAVKVIIATDSDSAGEFIAHSIVKFLKLSNIYRTYLNCLAENSVLESVRNAKQYQEESYYEMQNRFIIHHYLDKIFANSLGRLAWMKLAILDLFHNKNEFSLFRDIHNDTICFYSDNPVPAVYGDFFRIQKNKEIESVYQIHKPFNTATILEQIKQHYKDFTEAQYTLNQCFTYVQKDSKQALITYPRSIECGYYESTWNMEYENWIRKYPSETFAPAAIWPKTPMEVAHEGIHPADSSTTPEIMRPLVRKKMYDLYKLIYEHHQKVITKPEQIFKPCYRLVEKDPDNHIFPVDDSINDSLYDATPLVSIQYFLDYMVSTNSLRPSGFGKTLDDLIKTKWLNLEGHSFSPGISCEYVAGKINSFESIRETIALLNDKIHLQDIKRSKLFEDLTRISHIIFNS